MSSESYFATRVEMDWPPEMAERADGADIRLFREWPAPDDAWREKWGEGNAFVGYPDDKPQVTLELLARSEHAAAAKVMSALRINVDQFVVKPTPCRPPKP